MKTIQIRKVPERVHRALTARAASAGRSLSDFVLEELVRVASRPPVAEVLRRASERSGGADPRAIVDVVRASRDRA